MRVRVCVRALTRPRGINPRPVGTYARRHAHTHGTARPPHGRRTRGGRSALHMRTRSTAARRAASVAHERGGGGVADLLFHWCLPSHLTSDHLHTDLVACQTLRDDGDDDDINDSGRPLWLQRKSSCKPPQARLPRRRTSILCASRGVSLPQRQPCASQSSIAVRHLRAPNTLRTISICTASAQ